MRLPEFRIESVFLYSLCAAVLVGLLNLYSAGTGQENVFVKQMAATAIGCSLCAFFAYIDYRNLRRYTLVLYIVGNAVLLATGLFGHEVKSTRAWLAFGPISFQPSEIFKCVFILHLAAYLGWIQRERRATLMTGLFLPVVTLAIPVGLILHQGDAGTAAVFLPVFFTMLYMADLHFTLIGVALITGILAGATAAGRVYLVTTQPDLDPFIQKYLSLPYAGSAAGALLAILTVFYLWRLRSTHFRGGIKTRMAIFALVILFVGAQGGNAFYGKLKPHQKTRIASFFKPKIDPRGAGYQALQAEIAVGSGGIFGKGYLKGTQKRLGFLPEQWTDFAFSVLAEEWGFVGSIFTLLIYALLIGSAIVIGRHSTDLFGCLLATGTAALFFVHMTVGVAMNLGSFPVVGIPMPFLSYGGSAQIAFLALSGLVISVARHRRFLAA